MNKRCGSDSAASILKHIGELRGNRNGASCSVKAAIHALTDGSGPVCTEREAMEN